MREIIRKEKETEASLRSYEDVEPGTGPILDLADDADEPTDDARE